MLRALLDQPGMLPCEIAVELAISRPTVSRALDGLVERGLILRCSSESDGRECRVHPTASAVDMKVALNAAASSVTEKLKNRLGATEFTQAVQQMSWVRSVLG